MGCGRTAAVVGGTALATTAVVGCPGCGAGGIRS